MTVRPFNYLCFRVNNRGSFNLSLLSFTAGFPQLPFNCICFNEQYDPEIAELHISFHLGQKLSYALRESEQLTQVCLQCFDLQTGLVIKFQSCAAQEMVFSFAISTPLLQFITGVDNEAAVMLKLVVFGQSPLPKLFLP